MPTRKEADIDKDNTYRNMSTGIKTDTLMLSISQTPTFLTTRLSRSTHPPTIDVETKSQPELAKSTAVHIERAKQQITAASKTLEPPNTPSPNTTRQLFPSIPPSIAAAMPDTPSSNNNTNTATNPPKFKNSKVPAAPNSQVESDAETLFNALKQLEKAKMGPWGTQGCGRATDSSR